MKPNFCSACGAKFNDSTAFSPSCGLEIHGKSATVTATDYRVPPVLPSAAIANGHSKVTAVLLTIFFGLWGYLYSYKNDRKIFLLSLLSSPLLLGIAIVWILDASHFFELVLGLLSAASCIFLWFMLPLLTTAMRTQAWYDDYDRKHGAR